MSIEQPFQLFNTLSGNKERLEALDPTHLKIYACGPTVYNYAHIGNARMAVVFDTLVRTLRVIYPKVTYVSNITDIDDKIIEAAKEQNIAITSITEKYTQIYNEDMLKLNVLAPDIQPKATEYIPEMIELISELIEKDFAYEKEGHVLFHVPTYENYGKLSKRNREEQIAGSRVEVAPFKKDPADFVLWKPSTDDQPGWDSPWGVGRPGWHTECSAMSKKTLGLPFDIHGGGRDLIFPHHENEIAQSKCCFPAGGFANFWLHNEMLQVDGKKMSKSLGNFFTVRDLIEKGFPGEVIRFVFLSTHYRKPMDWTELKAKQADSTLRRWYDMCSNLEEDLKPSAEAIEVLSDDLNTPALMALLHKHFQSKNFAQLKADANLVGLMTPEFKDWAVDFDLSKYEEALMEVRSEAMITKNFDHLDDLKDKLSKAGVEIQMSTDTVRLVPTLRLDLAKLERIL